MYKQNINLYLMSKGYVLLHHSILNTPAWKIVPIVSLSRRKKTIYFPFVYKDKKIVYERG